MRRRAVARWRTALLVAALAGVAAAAPAQQADESEPAAAAATAPAALTPGAPEGAELTARTARPFDRYSLPVGPYARDRPNAREVEGRVVRSAWRLADAEATTAAVMAGYAERLAALGYEPVFRCTTEACGGFDFRFAVELMPPPAMLVDAADFAQLSARRAGPEGETFLSILISRLLGAVYVQTVAVTPATPAVPIVAMSDSPAAAPPGEADAFLERIVAQGHLPLHGIAFEPGSTAITGASAETLDRLADALAARPELAFLVVGHSDNQGGLEENIALSRRRAEAVRAALVERGIAAERLEARGVGFLAPLAPNDSEEGRAINRRVELVLR